LKKPKLTGGNSVPVNHQKEWRPRIVLDDRRPSQQKGKKPVFVRLGHRNAASRNLIPKKSVFDRLQFDLNQSSFVKRKSVFDRIQLPEARSSWAKKLDQGNVSSMAGMKHSNFKFSNSNAAGFKAGTPQPFLHSMPVGGPCSVFLPFKNYLPSLQWPRTHCYYLSWAEYKQRFQA
jgi:hypothetical protein